MSSHHFVKEGQEPALIVTNDFLVNDLGPLLEWSPLVVALPEAIEALMLAGIKIDVILAYESSFTTVEERIQAQLPVKILVISPTEDPLKKALEFLAISGQFHANIWTYAAHSLLSHSEEFLDRLEITIFDHINKCSAVRSGIFNKWYPANTLLHIINKGRIQIDPGNILHTGDQLLVPKEGLVKITSNEFFWVCESAK